MGALKSGDTLRSVSGIHIVIEDLLGEGGQGYVYKVKYGGVTRALKWYKEAFLKGMIKRGKEKLFYKNLSDNADNGAPTKSFLWPEDVTEWSGSAEDQFGYIMEVRPAGFNELTDYFMACDTGKSIFASDQIMVRACINVIEGFRELHNKGYSYQDINNGNFFINFKTGDVFICDNDNVSCNKENFGIQGKQRYMAPEIVLGGSPDKYSDRFSLAVILFRILFFRQHPFEGKYTCQAPCMTPDLEKRFYGEDPVFLFDPADKRNAPDPYLNGAAIQLWPLYPDFIKELFLKTFCKDGIQNPAKRPVDSDWLEAFVLLEAECGKCPKCGQEIFLDADKPITCSKCGTSLRAPYIVNVGKFRIPIIPDSLIPEYLVNPASGDCHGKMAKILRKKDPNNRETGIGNMSDKSWNVFYEDGTSKNVPPKGTAVINNNMKIQAGSVELVLTRSK